MKPGVEIARILLERQIEKNRAAAGDIRQDTPATANTISQDTPATANTINQNGRQPGDHTPGRPTRQTEGRK